MILLDTNVVSEPLKPAPDPVAVSWLDAQVPEQLYLPSVVAAELHYGWEALPEGRRRGRRRDLIKATIEQFAGRIVPFDLDAAVAYGRLMAAARAAGRSLPVIDGQIAAASLSRGATLATRNIRHFEPTGIPVVNPWEFVP